MFKNNHYNLDKCTLASWVDENLDQSLSQKKNPKVGLGLQEFGLKIQRQWITRPSCLKSTQQHL
jgi:hypothetical protein